MVVAIAVITALEFVFFVKKRERERGKRKG